MQTNNIGKLFEKTFQHTIMNAARSNIFTLRIADETRGERPADFLAINGPYSILIETKATEKDTISRSVVKLHQRQSLQYFSDMSKFSIGIVVIYIGGLNFVGFSTIEDYLKLPSKITKEHLTKLIYPEQLFEEVNRKSK